MRAAVRDMILRSYELQKDAWDAGAVEKPVLDPPVSDRLDEIDCPTLVLVGEEDVADMQAIAAHLSRSIRDARLLTLSGVAHLPNLERPDDVTEALLAFLADRAAERRA